MGGYSTVSLAFNSSFTSDPTILTLAGLFNLTIAVYLHDDMFNRVAHTRCTIGHCLLLCSEPNLQTFQLLIPVWQIGGRTTGNVLLHLNDLMESRRYSIVLLYPFVLNVDVGKGNRSEDEYLLISWISSLDDLLYAPQRSIIELSAQFVCSRRL